MQGVAFPFFLLETKMHNCEFSSLFSTGSEKWSPVHALQTAIASSRSSHSSFPVSASFPFAKSDMARPWKKRSLVIGEPQNKKRPGQLTTFHLQRSLGSWKEIRSMFSLAGAGEQRSPIPKHDSLGGAVAPVAEDTHTHPVVRWGAPERRRQHDKLDDHKKDTTFSSVDSPKPALHVVRSRLGSRHCWAELPSSNHSCSTLIFFEILSILEQKLLKIASGTFWTVGTKTSLTQASSRPAGDPK